tara:strand:- start:232 stop:450 length:219 start_codon:yes stop_codon:yes gene_type:complete
LLIQGDKYVQVKDYYYQIETKRIPDESSCDCPWKGDEGEHIEVPIKEHVVCETCHAPKLLQGMKHLKKNICH